MTKAQPVRLIACPTCGAEFYGTPTRKWCATCIHARKLAQNRANKARQRALDTANPDRPTGRSKARILYAPGNGYPVGAEFYLTELADELLRMGPFDVGTRFDFGGGLIKEVSKNYRLVTV